MTVVWMRILESAPSRYDTGIRILTLGRLDPAYDRLSTHIQEGWRVLDLGCGTGALTLRAARRGATVKGIDVNPQMLQTAQERAAAANLAQSVELCEMGVAELGSEPAQGYDAILSGLCFSELTEDELEYALLQAHRLLKPGGLLLVADEVLPRGVASRLLYWLIRLPLTVITYLVAQTTTHAVRGLPQRVDAVGLRVVSTRRSGLGSFIELIAQKPVEGAE
jgi:ubiquinone/menaquinone biosynthesis C-methylase UbiE